jgi:hypothetical protein
MSMTTTSKAKPMTDTEATDEAVLLLVRKLRRLEPEAFSTIWGKLPEGARLALTRADIRADVYRDHHPETVWPVEPDLDDLTGEA